MTETDSTSLRNSPPAPGSESDPVHARWLLSLARSYFFAWLVPALLLCTLGSLTEFLWHEHELRTLSESRQSALRSAGAIRSILESELNATVYLANGIESYIVGNKGKFRERELESMQTSLLKRSPHFRNISIAPDNRVHYIYPLAGNEKALGLHYPDNAEQWPLIQEIITSGQGRLIGPLPLIQGGNALIFRIPVFIEGHYWGLVSTVIDANKLLSVLAPLAESPQYQIALRGRDGLGARGGMIYGEPTLFNANSVLMDISTPGGTWQMAVAFKPPADIRDSLRAVGWLASLLLASMVYLLLALLRREQERNAQQAEMLAALRHAEQELASHRKHLEAEVEQRTTELHQSNQELRQAKEIAENAYQARSAFIANVSHEIRTPLHAVIGLTRILQQRAPRPEQQDCLGNILSSAQHLLRLINDILDLSRIEATKLAIVNQPFGTPELARQIHGMFAEQAEGKGLVFTVDFADLPKLLLGDADRLRQILINLVGNAVKFTEQGCIEVRAHIQDDNAGHLLARFEITDTGIGFDNDEVERIFAPFEQADNSTTRRFGGSGLGLSISRRLAELMGGECHAESQPEKGSIFWFTAKLHRQPE